MTQDPRRKAQAKPKKAYTAPVLVSLETNAVLDRLREASANGNEEAKSLLAQAEAVVIRSEGSDRSNVK